MSEIEFTKLQGLGNDFLIIEVQDVGTLRQASEIARLLCQRNYGAGADGVIFVTRARHADADFASRIFNSDGSEAGIRATARDAWRLMSATKAYGASLP